MESFLKRYKLNANLLAWHAEYPGNNDLDRGLREHLLDGTEDTHQILKFDSNGIWSVGPIEKITWQGPARHALAASIWPQTDERGTRCGELAGATAARCLLPRALASWLREPGPPGLGQRCARVSGTYARSSVKRF